MDWSGVGLVVHISAGYGAFGFGMAAALLPKFGRRAVWHRWIGRGYVVCMTIAAGLSIPLAARAGATVLLIVGFITLPDVVAAWLAIRRRRRADLSSATRPKLLRLHVVLMGSSYIAAWTAFLLNNPIFGGGTMWHRYFYIFGPTVIGTIAIRVALQRHRGRLHTATS